jgi:hypothetical protein
LGQIWGYSKCENVKSEVPFQIVGNCDDFFQKHGICDQILYFENIFSKMAKTHYQARGGGEKKLVFTHTQSTNSTIFMNQV